MVPLRRRRGAQSVAGVPPPSLLRSSGGGIVVAVVGTSAAAAGGDWDERCHRQRSRGGWRRGEGVGHQGHREASPRWRGSLPLSLRRRRAAAASATVHGRHSPLRFLPHLSHTQESTVSRTGGGGKKKEGEGDVRHGKPAAKRERGREWEKERGVNGKAITLKRTCIFSIAS